MLPVKTYTCKICDAQVKSHHRFCYNCGNNLEPDDAKRNMYNNPKLQSAFTFFFIYLFVCLVVKFTNLFNAYNRLFWIEILLAVLTLIYVYKNYSSIKPILKFRNFKTIRLVVCILIAATSSIIINLLVSTFNISFFGTDSGYYSSYSIYTMPAIIMIYSIAFNPALFEELAFRGVLYNYLVNFLDAQIVVVITAFMFSVVHLNLISLTWLLPFGIFAGEMRKRFNTIWYGVIFHFTFNLIAVLFDLHRNGYFR